MIKCEARQMIKLHDNINKIVVLFFINIMLKFKVKMRVTYRLITYMFYC